MPTDTPSHLLQLVSQALDELETAPVAASLRRALRIARLRGDEAEAYRFSLELGIEHAREELCRDVDRTASGAPSTWRADVAAAFVKNRTSPEDPRNLGLEATDGPVRFLLPVADLDIPAAEYEPELALGSRIEKRNLRLAIAKLLDGVRNTVFEFLIACETELRLAVTGDRVFAQYRVRVDNALKQVAPEVLDKLTAAIRRANDSDTDEARSQALTSCRRVLGAVADRVYPARAEPYLCADKKSLKVGPGQYRNRITAAIDGAGDTTMRSALRAAIGDFSIRLERLDALLQKGVHAEVSLAEMEFGVIQTYLLAGEVLATCDAVMLPADSGSS